MIADAYDAFLFDLDGVLYRGDEAIPRAAETVATLRQAGKRIAFVTNNSARTPEAVLAHLASVGVSATVEEIETSALTTASALAARGIATVPVDDRPDAVVVGWDRSVTYGSLRDASIAIQRGAAFFASNDDPSYPAPEGVTWPGAGAIGAALIG